MDPNTLNLDPDPNTEFWPNLNPDPGLCYQFWAKNVIISLKKNIFLLFSQLSR